jgi:hypothetical protein
MTGLITKILDAKTAREVDKIVAENIFQLPGNQRAHLCHFANDRKAYLVRIVRLENEVWAELKN